MSRFPEFQVTDLVHADTMNTKLQAPANALDAAVQDLTAGVTAPTRTLILLGSSLSFPETSGAEPFSQEINGVIVRGASYPHSETAVSGQVGCPMPMNWDRGPVRAEFVVTGEDLSGTVPFSIAGISVAPAGILATAFGTANPAVVDIGAGLTGWRSNVSGQTDPFTVPGSQPSAPGRRWVQWQITRDPGGTCEDDVVLLAVAVHYGTAGYGDV